MFLSRLAKDSKGARVQWIDPPEGMSGIGYFQHAKEEDFGRLYRRASPGDCGAFRLAGLVRSFQVLFVVLAWQGTSLSLIRRPAGHGLFGLFIQRRPGTLRFMLRFLVPSGRASTSS